MLRRDACGPAIHPGLADAAWEIARIARLGLAGVKLHPESQSFHPEDERMRPIYEACIQHRLIVLFHAGEDPNFETARGSPKVFRRLSERYPDLTIVLAHMGGYRRWDEVAEQIVGTRVYLDTSHATELLPPSDLKDLIRAHGVERVLFASDGPWTDAAAALGILASCGLDERELEAVLWNNAARLLGIG